MLALVLGLLTVIHVVRLWMVFVLAVALRQGLRSVRGAPGLLVPLLMMALVGTLAYEFQVALPLLAQVSLHGGAGTYGFLTAAMGVGAVAGGLVIAAWPGPACCRSPWPRAASPRRSSPRRWSRRFQASWPRWSSSASSPAHSWRQATPHSSSPQTLGSAAG